MNILLQYRLEIERNLNRLVQLEEEYRGKNKSSTYISKRLHYRKSIQHWTDKLKSLGKESTIILSKFKTRVKVNESLSKQVTYSTYLIGLNSEIAEKIIRLDYPAAEDFDHVIIQPGVYKEIRK